MVSASIEYDANLTPSERASLASLASSLIPALNQHQRFERYKWRAYVLQEDGSDERESSKKGAQSSVLLVLESVNQHPTVQTFYALEELDRIIPSRFSDDLMSRRKVPTSATVRLPEFELLTSQQRADLLTEKDEPHIRVQKTTSRRNKNLEDILTDREGYFQIVPSPFPKDEFEATQMMQSLGNSLQDDWDRFFLRVYGRGGQIRMRELDETSFEAVISMP